MTRMGVGPVVLVLAAVLLAGCSGGGPATVTSTFDDGAEGWTVTGDAQAGEAIPEHVPEGGADGGYVRATDDTAGGVWYWNASTAYVGDVSAYAGGTLSFELVQSSTEDPFDSPDVVLVRGDTRLGYDFGDAASHPGTDWTPYEVPLSADGWTNLDTGAAATDDEFETVLAALERLLIRGEYRTGSDVGGLDSVELSA